MSGTTISTYLDYGVVLGSSSFGGPLTITNAGGILPSNEYPFPNGTTALEIPVGVASPTINNGGVITGSAGYSIGYGYGNGGDGGIGIDASAASVSVNNTGIITGGSGGSAPNHYTFSYFVAGIGGVGVRLTGSSSTVTNSGQILGGSGGEQRYGPGGRGGAGVYLNGGVLINSGTIEGGVAGINRSGFYGPVADAVVGEGVVVIEPGAVFVGSLAFTGILETVESGQTEIEGEGGPIAGDVEVFFAGNDVFEPGESIVLDGFTATSNSFVTGAGLELSNGSDVVTLGLAGSFSTGDFSVVVADGDTTITGTNELGNGPLELIEPAAVTINVGQSGTIGGVSLSETGTTSSEIFTIALSDANGLLSATGAGITGSGSTSLTITGSLALVNADLATLQDTDATAALDTIALSATDSLGSKTGGSIAVTVNSSSTTTSTNVYYGKTSFITGSSGANSFHGAEAGNGGIGVSLPGSPVTVTNGGQIMGGNGGNGAYTFTDVYGGHGGTALYVPSGQFFNSGSIVGGAGGFGTPGFSEGGDGGDGVVAASGINTGYIAGGSGGSNGAGGIGGDGIYLTGGSLVNSGFVTGGAAGIPDANDRGSYRGGIGVSVGAGVLVNSGAIQGGAGATGFNYYGGGRGYAVGGAGVDLRGGTVINYGIIEPAAVVGEYSAPDVEGFGVIVEMPGAYINVFDPLFNGSLAFNGVLETVGTTQTQLAGIGGSFNVGYGYDASQLNRNVNVYFAGGAEFGPGKTIVVEGFNATSDLYVNGYGLELSDGTNVLTLGLAGSFSTSNFSVSYSVAYGIGGTTITATNEPGNGPLELTKPAAVTLNVGQSNTIGGVSLSETGTTSSEIFTIALSDANGLLSATGAGITGSGSTALTITGSLALVNADLATLQDTDWTVAPDTITLSATDSLGGDTGGVIAVTVSNTISTAITQEVTLGVGVNLGSVTITNAGAIQPSTYGSTALEITYGAVSAKINNHGFIIGGAGAPAQYNRYNGPSSYVAPGNGGIGIDGSAPGVSLNNTGVIAGGDGGNYVYHRSANSGPGNGGVGVRLAGNTVTNSGQIQGGNGGNVEYGGGGFGGTALYTAQLINSGDIAGGAGGQAKFGGGGSGGNGVVAASVTNTGDIAGGFGGSGSRGAGNGGIGVDITGAGSLTNSGLITGGNAGRDGGGYGQRLRCRRYRRLYGLRCLL